MLSGILATGLLFYLALLLVGSRAWQDEVHDAFQAEQHSASAGVDRSSGQTQARDRFAQRYIGPHRQHHDFWLVRFPLLVTGCAALYFLPPMIALLREDPRTESLFLITVFLGVTGLGWLWALSLAVRGPPPGR